MASQIESSSEDYAHPVVETSDSSCVEVIAIESQENGVAICPRNDTPVQDAPGRQVTADSLVLTGDERIPTYVPEYMRVAKRWVVRVGKLPFYPNGTPRTGDGKLDSEMDRALLGTYDEACAALIANPHRFTGIGFALGPDGDGYWQGIDLDKVQLNRLASLANNAPGYVEFSPSGQGIHAIGFGRHFEKLGSNGCGIEAYVERRYFTFTGNMIRDGGMTCIAEYVEQHLAPVHDRARSQSRLSRRDDSAIHVDPQTITDLRSALNFIRADDYELWIRLGIALRELGVAGRELWLTWSATSEKFRPQDATKWDTFSTDRTGYQAVFAEAQRQGWINPNSKAATASMRTADIADDVPRIVPVDDVFRNPPSAPEFLTDQLMPAGEVTLLAAHGGTGKSYLMLMWAVHAALGRPFLGKEIVHAPAIFYSGEDRADVVRFRVAKICRALGFDPGEVAASLTVLDATDAPVLFVEQGDHKGRSVTPVVYERFKNLILDKYARHVFVDNASDVFDGDEIRRAVVRKFLREMRRLGEATRAGVMLAAHVDKLTAKGVGGGQGYSGSTAWNNSVRSRLFMTDESGELVLRHEKSNHCRLSDPIYLRWGDNGILEARASGEIESARKLMDHAQRASLVEIIGKLCEAGIDVPTATTGPQTLFKALRAHPDFPHGLDSRRTNMLILQAEVAQEIRREEFPKKHRKMGERWLPA